MTSWSERVSPLAARFDLPPAAPEQLGQLLELLVSDPNAPTTIRDRRRALDDHIADSLVALGLPEVRQARSFVDIGSGAGLPGLVLGIALPDIDAVLLESSSRKVSFITEAIDACGVRNATAVHARAESWPQGLGRFDLATARALAPLPVVAEYAAPLLRIGGALVAWRGRRDSVAEASGERAADELGLESRAPVQVWPYEGAVHRYLHLMSKVRETPARFPRRPGMAAKRPLGTKRQAV